MHWKKKAEILPKIDDTRIITKFLLFPKCLSGTWKWLELAKIKQVFVKNKRGYDIDFPTIYIIETNSWKDMEWID